MAKKWPKMWRAPGELGKGGGGGRGAGSVYYYELLISLLPDRWWRRFSPKTITWLLLREASATKALPEGLSERLGLLQPMAPFRMHKAIQAPEG